MNMTESKTYSEDWDLFQKLGLKTFKTYSRDKFCVGEYKLPNCEKASIKVSVTCMPVQFWHLEIETDEGNKYVVNTGSGALSEYWASAVKLAEDCFDVEKL